MPKSFPPAQHGPVHTARVSRGQRRSRGAFGPLALALALLAALFAVRPSFAQNSQPQQGQAPHGQTQNGQAKGELVFGMSAAFSGPARGLGAEYCRGLQAGLEHINAEGGVRGWTLRLIMLDDGYDPVPAVGNTIRFVEEERVFALLGYVGTPTTARVLPLLKRYQNTGVVLLFPFTGADMLREPPYNTFVFNMRASYMDETRTVVDALLKSGRRRIAVFYQADVYGRNGWDGVRRSLGQHNLSIVSEASYKRGASYANDFRREVELIAKAKPDAIVTVGTAPACAAFVRDARGAGLQAAIAALSFADADNMLKFLNAQGRVSGRDFTQGLVFSQVVPSYEDASLPAVRLYRQVMDQARLGKVAAMMHEEYVPNRYSFVSFEGFLASRVLASAVGRISGPPTRQALREALSGLRGLDIGIGEDVSFAQGDNQGLRRTYLAVYRAGQFVGVQGLEPLPAANGTSPGSGGGRGASQ